MTLKSTANQIQHILTHPNSKNLTIIAISALLLAGAGTAIYLKTAKVAAADSPVAGESISQSNDAKVVDEHFSQVTTSYVQYISMDALPAHERADAMRKLHLKMQTGSTSGGVLTREFKPATHAMMTYRFGRRQPLLFKPIDAAAMLPTGFILTGREYQGEPDTTGKYRTFYRLFENPNDKMRIEVIETIATSDAPIQLIQELFRDRVIDTPVKFERFSDKKGVRYYGAEFTVGDKHYQINTKGVSSDELLDLIARVINSH